MRENDKTEALRSDPYESQSKGREVTPDIPFHSDVISFQNSKLLIYSKCYKNE